MKKNYSGVMALKEHMLAGHRISNLESLLLFGVQNLKNEVRLMRNDGCIIKSQKVAMAKILHRTNKYTLCKPPKNLPTKEILSMEYWISK